MRPKDTWPMEDNFSAAPPGRAQAAQSERLGFRLASPSRALTGGRNDLGQHMTRRAARGLNP